MALVTRMASDLTGKEAPEAEFVQLVVREHPATDEPKALDVLPDEIANLKSAGELVVLEVKNNGDSKQLVVSVADFRKLCKDEVVQAARGLRGRRPGYSPASR